MHWKYLPPTAGSFASSAIIRWIATKTKMAADRIEKMLNSNTRVKSNGSPAFQVTGGLNPLLIVMLLPTENASGRIANGLTREDLPTSVLASPCRVSQLREGWERTRALIPGTSTNLFDNKSPSRNRRINDDKATEGTFGKESLYGRLHKLVVLQGRNSVA